MILITCAGRAESAELRRVDVEILGQAGVSAYPWQAAVSPDGAHVYVVAALLHDDGPTVLAFARAADGSLLPIAGPTITGSGNAGRYSIASSADGRHLYVGIGSEQLVTFARDAATGSLTQIDFRYDVSARVTSSPDGRNVYALFPALLVTYTRDDATGLLTRTDLENGITGPAAFDGAVGLGLSPDGRHVYLGSTGTPSGVGPSLTVFARDPATGALAAVETMHDGENGVAGITLPMHVAVSPDGHNVYASGGSDDVATFARDVASGTLTFLGVAAGAGFESDFDGGLAVRTDGERVVVAGGELGGAFAHDGITIFRRDVTTGLLTRLETLVRKPEPAAKDLAGPTSVAFAPDGRDLYVTAAGDAALTAYRVLPHCSAEPLAGCRQPTRPGRSTIVLGHGSQDTLLWQWRSGEATAASDFGTPQTTTDYTFCLHRESGGDWTNVLQLTVPAASTCGPSDAPCWRAAGTPSGGQVFRDPAAVQDGVTDIRLTPGPDGRASIVLRGRGTALDLPPLPLGPAQQVVAQLRTGDGHCWSADYAAPARRDDGARFSDRN